MEVTTKVARAMPPSRREKLAEWDARGVKLTALELSFSSRASPKRWIDVVEEVGLTRRPRGRTDQGPAWTASILALPKQAADWYLSGLVHPMPKAPATAHWVLKFKPMPKGQAPAVVKAVSESVKGIEGFLQSLGAHWPVDGNVSAKVSNAVYLLDRKRWRGVQGFEQALALGSGRLRTDFVGWEVVPPAGPVELISQARADDADLSSVVTVTGQLSVHVGPSLVTDCDEALWQGLQKLLDPAT